MKSLTTRIYLTRARDLRDNALKRTSKLERGENAK